MNSDTDMADLAPTAEEARYNRVKVLLDILVVGFTAISKQDNSLALDTIIKSLAIRVVPGVAVREATLKEMEVRIKEMVQEGFDIPQFDPAKLQVLLDHSGATPKKPAAKPNADTVSKPPTATLSASGRRQGASRSDVPTPSKPDGGPTQGKASMASSPAIKSEIKSDFGPGQIQELSSDSDGDGLPTFNRTRR